MSVIHSQPAFANLPAPAFALPCALGAKLAALGPVAAALLRVRELREALSRGCFRRRPENGGPETPREDHSQSDSIWDDPELWMLMMH